MLRIVLAKRGNRRPLQRQHPLAQLDSPWGIARGARTGVVSGCVQRAHYRKKLGTRIDGNGSVSFVRRGRGGSLGCRRLRVRMRERKHEQYSSEARVPHKAIIVKNKPQSVIQSVLEFTRPSQLSQESLL